SDAERPRIWIFMTPADLVDQIAVQNCKRDLCVLGPHAVVEFDHHSDLLTSRELQIETHSGRDARFAEEFLPPAIAAQDRKRHNRGRHGKLRKRQRKTEAPVIRRRPLEARLSEAVFHTAAQSSKTVLPVPRHQKLAEGLVPLLQQRPFAIFVDEKVRTALRSWLRLIV